MNNNTARRTVRWRPSLLLLATTSLVPLATVGSVGGAVAAGCSSTGDIVQSQCDSTEVDYRLGAGDITLTVDSVTSARLVFLPDGGASGPINATLNIIGTTKIDRPDYSAVLFNTDGTGRDQASISVFAGPDVEITGDGQFGAIFLNNRGTGPVSLETAATVLAKGDGQNGIWMRSGEGAVLLNNSGDVTSEKDRGLYADGNGLANAPGGGGIAPADIRIINSGNVKAATRGIRTANWLGLSAIENSGTVDALRNQALITWSNKGTSSITNSGTVISRDNHAIQAISSDGPAIIVNSGSATSRDNPNEQNETTGQHGLFARANAVGDVSITNMAAGKVDSIEVGIRGEVRQSGDISIVQAGQVMAAQQGIQALSADGAVSVTNSGTVTAAWAGVELDGTTNSLMNSGMVTSGSTSQAAIVTGDGDTTIKNSGAIANTGGAEAIMFGNGTNRLVLDAGTSVIDGVVQGGKGNDHLVLDVDAEADLSLLLIGASGQFRGFEFLEKTGNGVLTVTDDGTGFSGTTHVRGGTLRLDGVLGGTGSMLVVDDAGILNGIGGVGGDAAFSGIVSPGNSIGTLTVAGDVAFNTGSTLQVEVAPDGTSDLLAVGGAATISGDGTTLDVTILPGAPPQTAPVYTVLRADGGVTGQFATVTDATLPDLDLVARYTATEIQLVFEGATDGNLSPKEIHPSALGAGMQGAVLFGETLRRRGGLVANQLSGSSQGATARSALLGFVERPAPESRALPAHALAADMPSLPSEAFAAPRDRWAVWGAVLGQDLSVDADGATPGWDAQTGGLAFGFECHFEGLAFPTLAGLAFGYARSSVDSGASDADIDAFHIGAYAATRAGALTLSGALAYAWQDYAFERVIPVAGTRVIAEGDTDGQTFVASAEAFYDMSHHLGAGWPGQGLRFGPLATIDAVHGEQDGFTETGAGILDLTVSGTSADQVVTGLGIGFGVDRAMGATLVSLDGRVAWEHVFGDRSISTVSAIPVANAVFTSGSAPVSRDRLAVGVGAAIAFTDTISTELRYDGAFADTGNDHQGTASLTIRF